MPDPWPEWITGSYERALGEPLCGPSELDDLAAVVLCHDTSADPLFVYANRAAEALWQRRLVGTPSRLTAPPDARAERATALRSGLVVRGYSGERVSASGRRFRILDATVWDVVDEHGVQRGQAATFVRTEPVGG
jgi:hypothetical protein